MNYTCCTFKPISASDTYHPQNLDETRGDLLRIFLKDGFCIAVFIWGCVAFPAELHEELAALVGRKCAILRIEGRFLVRDLEREEHAA
jgi:hypothetical protein